MTRSFMAIRRVRVMAGASVEYDQEFHHGVNVIRGENSSGKSTIADFIFYGLGGEFDRWKDAASRCTAVRLELETASSTLTLHRAIGTRQEPVSVYYGPLADSLEADIDAWQRFPIRRPPGGNDLSITQVLFRAIGLPEAPSLGNSNVTMHQVMRLLYADQQTPAGKLFRFESFDTRDIREVVGQLLIGVNGYELYENQIRQRELKAEYAEKNRDYHAAVAALPSSEGLTSVAMLDARSGALVEEKARVLSEIANADDLVGADQTGEFAADRRSMQTKLRAVAGNLNRLEERGSTLSDEIGEIEQFAAYLEDQLETLSATDELAERIGNIEFQYCPACLKPLEDGEPGHCIVCHQVLDVDEVKSKYFEIRIDTELQIRESRQLLDAKNTQLQVAQADARVLRRDYTALLTDFAARYDISNSPRESFLAERNRRIGRIDYEIGHLEEIRSIVQRIDALSAARVALNDEIERVEKLLKRLFASATSRTNKAMTLIGSIGCNILKKDLPREDAFEDPTTFSINFGDDAMLVDGKMNFAESSNVVLKNAAISSMLFSACYDPEFWHPRFLLMDNIEDKGMEAVRTHNFQRLLIAEAQKVKVPFQLIFTTSMPDDSLEGSDLTVGPRYSRQSKTLAHIVTKEVEGGT
ncbi:AAA family ATPase [Tardiphaga sp. 813_E8_N1_3]|uniref:AAA family ATPase n=1 Tax=Tardiphaga sp. 813_E8_N1_3 TaxID=3240760 RepID=UPI003F288FA5